jgi:TetR/AcrR family transcriptional regulator
MADSSHGTEQLELTPKARTRARVLAAASELFAEHGLDEVSVEQIAERAGVSVGTVYQHFKNKGALNIAWIEAEVSELAEAARATRQLERPLDRVHAIGDAFLRFAIEHPVVMRYSVYRAYAPTVPPGERERGEVLRHRNRDIVVMVAADLHEAMELGHIARRPVDELAFFLWSAWQGAISQMVRLDALRVPPELVERSLLMGRALVDAALTAELPPQAES